MLKCTIKSLITTKSGLDKKLQKILETSPSFELFRAIHDFIESIEENPAFLKLLSPRIKINKELGIPDKYAYLKQVYQAFEDMKAQSTDDLGHARYSVIRELNAIKDGYFSDTNSFWKRRELSKKLSQEIYDRLNGSTPKPKAVKKKGDEAF